MRSVTWTRTTKMPRWVADYSIIFDSCHTLVQVADEANEDQGMIYNKNLVTFYLCPTETCGSHVKNCGKYVVGMEEFVDSWTEAKVSSCVQRMSCACRMLSLVHMRLPWDDSKC